MPASNSPKSISASKGFVAGEGMRSAVYTRRLRLAYTIIGSLPESQISLPDCSGTDVRCIMIAE